MSRRIALAGLTGLVLLGGLGAPAMAGPADEGDGETVVCVRTDSTSGKRDGICVVLPIGR